MVISAFKTIRVIPSLTASYSTTHFNYSNLRFLRHIPQTEMPKDNKTKRASRTSTTQPVGTVNAVRVRGHEYNSQLTLAVLFTF